jgi:hypothetical protein
MFNGNYCSFIDWYKSVQNWYVIGKHDRAMLGGLTLPIHVLNSTLTLPW